MHFFFKTDANENIGSGHLQRCLNIASLIDKVVGTIVQFSSDLHCLLNPVTITEEVCSSSERKRILILIISLLSLVYQSVVITPPE